MSYFYAKRTQQSLIKPTIFMKRALLLFLAFTAAWLAGCDKQDDGPAPELTLSGGTEKTLATGGGSESVTFTTNTTWSAEIASATPGEWCRVSPESGRSRHGHRHGDGRSQSGYPQPHRRADDPCRRPDRNRHVHARRERHGLARTKSLPGHTRRGPLLRYSVRRQSRLRPVRSQSADRVPELAFGRAARGGRELVPHRSNGPSRTPRPRPEAAGSPSSTKRAQGSTRLPSSSSSRTC